MKQTDPLTVLDGVGPALAGRLADGLGIRSIADLLAHYPRRYHDAGAVLALAEVEEGQPATLIGEVRDWSRRRVPARGRRARPLDLATGTVQQADGARFTVTFFNQPWRPGSLPVGTLAAFSGTVKRFRQQLQLTGPDVQVLGRASEQLDQDRMARELDHQRLLAVYPAVEQVPAFTLNRLIEQALEALEPLEDWLPDELRRRAEVIGLDDAVRTIHRPADHEQAAAARRRLAFDELFTLQLGLQWRRRRLEAATVGVDNAPGTDGLADRFLTSLPFALTAAQQRAITELTDDLAARRPMHRLLQGDVGAGKTVIALWAMLAAIDHGRQAALMVPTEVLAEQHHHTICELLAPLGVNVLDGVRVGLLTSSTGATERRRLLGELLSGTVDLLVGTHALLEEGVRFADLGVVVIDEQHRFGVAQRTQLRDRSTSPAGGTPATPDVLVMTATPIPRSLALTVYGDLDVTVLDELPAGRQPVITQLITPAEAHRRQRLESFIRAEAASGRRAFIVCPFVEPSDAVAGRSAIVEHERLQREVFPELSVGLVHGRLSTKDKEAAMDAIRRGDVQVLVSTTVIEVGIDVPEASVMVIEDAERFGISQLHQLRGRVGRGSDQSYCVLFGGWSAELSDDGAARLQAVAASTDGFALAEADLQLRGAGQLFGRAQSGVPDLLLADLRHDRELLVTARQLAVELLERDPELQLAGHGSLRGEVRRRYEGLDAFAWLQSG